MRTVLKASGSYRSDTAVPLVLYPLGEPSHSRMVSQRLHGVVASFEVCVADGVVDVTVAGTAQGNRPAWVASLKLLPALPPALHLLGAGAWQEMVAGEMILADASAAQLTPAVGANSRFSLLGTIQRL